VGRRRGKKTGEGCRPPQNRGKTAELRMERELSEKGDGRSRVTGIIIMFYCVF
jgi:predicted RNA-binding protein with TRAM domain